MATTTNPSKAKAPPRATTLTVPRTPGRAPKPEAPSSAPQHFIKWFADIGIDDVPLVGGKNASSDYPDFAQFLVEQGIDSISLNPDTVLKTTVAIVEKEKAQGVKSK